MKMQVRAARPNRDSAGGSSGQINRAAAHSGSSKTNWHLILTGAEFWFFCDRVNSRIWLRPDVGTPEVAQRLINAPTMMITAFWNQSALDVNKFLEGGTSFNSAYFADYVLSEIEHLPALQTAVQKRTSLSFTWTIHPFTSHVP
jgi:hypothetical protein